LPYMLLSSPFKTWQRQTGKESNSLFLCQITFRPC
jgi:hypothetical protein